MPHFPIFKSDSATTKMRIVYDASARMSPKSPSLNDCLHTGPNLMQDLTGILLKFRTHKKAFSADIEKAFLQIELNSLDRDATRFLWLKDLPHDTKFPILIPKDNYLTTFIVHSMHKQVMHGGVRETFTHIRQTYWIPQGRQLVKRIISKCVTCRKVEGPPFRSVPTPPLPQSRVQQSKVFQFTGIDYAGPLYVRDQKNQTSSKMYICLFTCAVVKAIHLELLEDQTTDAFLRAFRRFISRRGVPECIISDNAKTFKAGAQELQTIKTQILGTGSSQQFLAHHNITWKFITERAPWWGGFHERLIGLMKRCLKKNLGKACLNMIELNTILTEVEAVLNRRPLTYPYTDINDVSPLTPSHFLCGFRLVTLPDTNAKENEADPDYIPSEMSTKALIKRAQYQKTLINAFWTRWKTEYLTSLREHHTCRKRILNKKAVAIGDVVLIHDNTPRNQWKIGVVTSLHTGKDELVRSVSLRVPSWKGTMTTYRETLSVRDVRHTD